MLFDFLEASDGTVLTKSFSIDAAGQLEVVPENCTGC